MDIRKCYAYNAAGLRCMQPAGHDGEHAHAITWTDDECWEPGTPALVVTPTAPPVVETRGVCVICDHRMHKGPCRSSEGEFGCDCAEGVE